MRMRIQKINENAVIPTKGTQHSAGLDLTAIDYELKDEGSNGIVYMKTGLVFEIPEGHSGEILLRSSIAKKGKWSLANSVGLIDSDYRGEIIIMLRYVGTNRFYARQVNFTSEITELLNTRIAQIVIRPYVSVKISSATDLTTTERGEGGFGSTGK